MRPKLRAGGRELALVSTVLAVLIGPALPMADNGPLDEISALIKDRQYISAAEKARSLLSELESTNRGETMEAAQALDLLVEASWRGRSDGPDTRALIERAVHLKEELAGPDDPAVADSLHQLGNLLNYREQYPEARDAYERVLEIREATFGPDALEIVPTLNNLGGVVRKLGDLARAGDILQRALSIREQRLPPDHLDRATSLHGLASVLEDLGDYSEAESRYRLALGIREKGLPPADPRTLSTINSLAGVLLQEGDFGGAEMLYQRVLDQTEESAGADSLGYALYLGNLAVLKMESGDYAAARELQNRVLVILKKNLPSDDRKIALALNNQGYLLNLMGDYLEAQAVLEKALEIRRKVLAPDHYDTVQTLTNLANAYHRSGRLDLTRKYHDEALAMARRRLGPEDLRVAVSLVNLGELEAEAGNDTEARRLLEKALAIKRRVLGNEHPDVATAVLDLAGVMARMGKTAEARELYEMVLAIREKVFGPDHPAFATALAAYAEFLALSGSRDQALAPALRAEAAGRDHARLVLASLGERQGLALAAVRPSGLDVLLSLARSGLDPVGRRQVWDALIRSRAIALESLVERRSSLASAANPDVERLEQELARRRRQMANLVLRGPDPRNPSRYGAVVERARLAKEESETALSMRSARHRDDRTRDEIGWKEVATSLPPGAVLVAYAHYSDILASHQPWYVAFVLTAARSEPNVVSLGPAADIEPRIRKWYLEASASPIASGRKPRQAEADYRHAGEELRKLLWDPILPFIGHARQVFVVPDGALHLVNLSTLPVGMNRYLVEEDSDLHLLLSERSLAERGNQDGVGSGLLALGAPDFEASPSDVVSANGSVRASAGSTVEGSKQGGSSIARGAESGECAGLGNVRFEALPSSQDEIDRVAALWKERSGGVVALTGAAAGEAALKRAAPGHRVLHLATHAFLVDPACPSSTEQRYAAAVLDRWHGALPQSAASVQSPLLLSGLALAGANHRLDVPARSDSDDGMLTAEEISSLDLTGTEWVVLSACETALGELRQGEGVIGLRRAVLGAGARTVIMSLWQVQDEFATAWMERLYRARLAQKLSTARAVHQASAQALKHLRGSGRTTHPYFWGAFVAVGDWR